jgi:hypothetical protein
MIRLDTQQEVFNTAQHPEDGARGQMRAIWANVLKRDMRSTDMKDSFFRLGGD